MSNAIAVFPPPYAQPPPGTPAPGTPAPHSPLPPNGTTSPDSIARHRPIGLSQASLERARTAAERDDDAARASRRWSPTTLGLTALTALGVLGYVFLRRPVCAPFVPHAVFPREEHPPAAAPVDEPIRFFENDLEMLRRAFAVLAHNPEALRRALEGLELERPRAFGAELRPRPAAEEGLFEAPDAPPRRAPRNAWEAERDGLGVHTARRQDAMREEYAALRRTAGLAPDAAFDHEALHRELERAIDEYLRRKPEEARTLLAERRKIDRGLAYIFQPHARGATVIDHDFTLPQVAHAAWSAVKAQPPGEARDNGVAALAEALRLAHARCNTGYAGEILQAMRVAYPEGAPATVVDFETKRDQMLAFSKNIVPRLRTGDADVAAQQREYRALLDDALREHPHVERADADRFMRDFVTPDWGAFKEYAAA